MPKSVDYEMLMKISESDPFTIMDVIDAPRICNPVDLQAALTSVRFEADGEVPLILHRFASYIVHGWFAYAHRTGLYNRQRKLWEAMAAIVQIQFIRPKQGLFKKIDSPFTEVYMLDYKGNTIIFAMLVDPVPATLPKLKHDQVKFLRLSIRRAEQIQNRQGLLKGVFVGLPAPVQEKALKLAVKWTGGSDPVARYESHLPWPLKVPLNLFSVCFDILREPSNGSLDGAIHMVHPLLRQENESVISLESK